MSLRKVSLLGLISTLLAGLALGSEAIPNWPAPATWSPPRARGVSTLSETNPLPFQAVTPCRVADTRGNGFAGAYGPPSLAANATRSFTITGQCGIPASAAAVSFNFGALNVGGAGDLRVFPSGGSIPLVSTLNYNANTPDIANAAVVELGTGGAITVQADAVSIDLIIDVNGYYYGGSASLATGETFTLVGDVAGSSTGVLSVHNTETTFGQVRAGYFLADSAGFGSVAVAAYESAGSGLTSGIYGQASSSTSFSAGVTGAAVATTGRVYGIRGLSSSMFGGAAGVNGVDGTGDPGEGGVAGTIGVRGASTASRGVVGVSKFIGTEGVLADSAGAAGVAYGQLGTSFSGVPYGVFSGGDYGGTGAKYFIEPHPSDASKVIRYVSLEGPESGTYFRGTARTVHGEATIEVPESFRMVTDEEGLTVQLTPVGSLATLAVINQDLDRIVVRSSKDVTFHYLAQGVRRAFKDHQAIGEGSEFMPESATQTMPLYLTEEAKRRLIANGTYNADGTVNMETAERLGWAKAWRERGEQGKAATAANAAHTPK